MNEEEMQNFENENAVFEDERPDEVTPGETVKKIIDLELSEKQRVELLKKFLNGDLSDMPQLAFTPTRDIGHGRTFPIDEFKASSDYEIALHLLNLNQRKFSKAALFFFLMSVFDVTITRSRDGFLIKELRTYWSGSRKEEDENKEWFVSPKMLLGKIGGRR